MPEAAQRKKNIRRRAAAIIAIVLAVLIAVTFMEHFLCIPNSFDENRVITLHKEPRDSIDVLLIGSSATYSGFASAYAYEKYGFTSFPYAIGGATCTMWKPALQDALRTQSPKLVVVDVFGGGYERELIDSRNNQIYTIMAHFPFCAEKIAMAKEISKTVDRTSVASLIFPFLKYHNSVPVNLRRIKGRLEAEDYGPSPLKGIETWTRVKSLADVDEISFSSEAESLDGKTEGIIRDFMDYCKEKDVNVLFVKYPTVLTENDPDELLVNRRANRILEIADEYGFHSFNMQKHFHDIGLEEKKDYYNHGHTNVRGQKKVTEYLGRYIQDELGIGPSELDEETRAEWDESIPYYHAFTALAEEMTADGIDYTIGESPDLVNKLRDR